MRPFVDIILGDIILSISQTGPGYCFIARFAAIDTDGEVMYVDGMQELPTQILGAEEAKGPVQEAHFVLHYNIELVSFPSLVSSHNGLTRCPKTGWQGTVEGRWVRRRIRHWYPPEIGP